MTVESERIGQLAKAIKELDATRRRLVEVMLELEADRAIALGTLAQPVSETLTEYTHDVPPDAPR